MGCRAEKMRRDSPPHIFANNIIRRAKTEAERQSINIFPTQIYEPSAVLGLSNVHESKKERLRGGQMDMKKHRKHELEKT